MTIHRPWQSRARRILGHNLYWKARSAERKVIGWWFLGRLPETITIRVTVDHLRRGIRHSSWECPVALAAREQVPYLVNVNSHNIGVYPRLKPGESVFNGTSRTVVKRLYEPDNPGIYEEWIHEYDRIGVWTGPATFTFHRGKDWVA